MRVEREEVLFINLVSDQSNILITIYVLENAADLVIRVELMSFIVGFGDADLRQVFDGML